MPAAETLARGYGARADTSCKTGALVASVAYDENRVWALSAISGLTGRPLAPDRKKVIVDP